MSRDDDNYPKTLFDKMGGMATLKMLMDAVMDLVVADPELKPFFRKVDVTLWKTKFVYFMAHFCGSPIEWMGKSMTEAHKHK